MDKPINIAFTITKDGQEIYVIRRVLKMVAEEIYRQDNVHPLE